MIINYGNLVAFGNQTWLTVLAGKFLNEMEGEGMGLGTIWEDKGDKLTTA